MAQLHHILGSILRDIAQARVTSDIYSREVSQFYEQDSLLRLFPIPRTEIKEIEIDLKFAISEISIDPDRSEDADGKISGIYERYSEIIANSIFEKLYIINKTDTSFQSKIADIDTIENRAALNAAIFDYFGLNGKRVLVKKSVENQINLSLDQTTLIKELSPLCSNFISAQIGTMVAKSLTAMNSGIKKELTPKMDAMNGEVEYLETSEYKAEVIVSNQELQVLPEGSISSIKIVTTLKNYVWSQVEEKDGKVIRRLIPE